MTAALTVSGLAGSMPAAHAGGSASCIFIGGINASIVCTGNNIVNVPITVTVTGVGNGNDISLIETEIENVIVGNGNRVIVEALNAIGNSVTTITNLHCVSVQVGSGNVAITKVCAY